MGVSRFNMEPRIAVSLVAATVIGGIALYRAYRDQGMEKPEEQAQYAAGLDEPIGGVHQVAAYQRRRSHRKRLADFGGGDSLVDTLSDTLADNLTDPLADSLSG
jgi:hypothetical protein